METKPVPETMKLLPSDVLAKFARTKIHARRLMAGSKNGDHRSPFLGTSTEFAEHREYSQGDDPRTLDWRVYGKQDRYYVKKYIEESNLRATILLDCSASMGFCGEVACQRDGRRLSKLDYANRLAAILAYQFIQQGDAVGLVQMDSRIRNFLPASSKPSRLRWILQALHDQKPQNASQLPAVVHRVAQQLPTRGIVILISDFLEETSELKKALYHLKHRNHELILFHVLADEELTFPFGSATRFRDMEGIAEAIDVDPEAIRREYLNQLGEHLEALRQGAKQVEADYVRFNTRVAYEESLASYLVSRMRR